MQYLTLQISARFLKQCIYTKTTNILVTNKIYSALVIIVHLHAISIVFIVFINVILVIKHCNFSYKCNICVNLYWILSTNKYNHMLLGRFLCIVIFFTYEGIFFLKNHTPHA